jgi:hypothetical protein
MKKSKKKIDPIPEEFKTLMEASEFWDSHDASDYWDKTKEAKFKSTLTKEPKYVAIENTIAKKVFVISKKRRISTETLINLWLKEKISAA